MEHQVQAVQTELAVLQEHQVQVERQELVV